jgi:hypothetical protein
MNETWFNRALQRSVPCSLALSVILFGSVFLAGAVGPGSANATADFAAPPVDDGFTNALAAILRTSRLRETHFAEVLPDWRTNLCLLLGMRVDDGKQSFVRLLELTTLPLPPTNAPPKAGAAADAQFELTAGDTSICNTARVYRFKSPRCPVRLRVFDPQGRQLAEERLTMSWRFLTNGLAAPCLLFANATNPAPGATRAETNAFRLQAEAACVQSVTALVALFGDALGADALEEFRDRAMVIARMPNWFKVITQLGLRLSLSPHFERTTLLPARPGVADEVRASFPVELTQDKRILTNVRFLVGSTQGPHFLTAGVRAMQATHPTKPDHRLLAQVLAVGEIPPK